MGVNYFFGCRSLLIHKMFDIVRFIFLIDFKDPGSPMCLHKKVMRGFFFFVIREMSLIRNKVQVQQNTNRETETY